VRPLAFALALFVTLPAWGGDYTARVVKIADGDTITVLRDDNTQERVRLASIDAPERDLANRVSPVRVLATGPDSSTISGDLPRRENPRTGVPLDQLPRGRWVKIHEQSPTDDVFFRRQKHGGSAFDTRRGHLVLFGSDTHGRDWTNSPLIFDIARLKWRRLYPDDPLSTYKVNEDGLPVAGRHGQHPWAMHTFGAVEYDARRDELIVSSYPKHMAPGRFSNALAQLWPNVKQHPTWVLNLATEKWHPLGAKAVHFFPNATAFDSDRGVVVGYRRDGVYELSGSPRHWDRVLRQGLFGYHNNAVYDTSNKKIIVMGSNENSNDVVVYDPATQSQRKMPTTGQRPPKDQHIPMAFHGSLGKTIALVDQVPVGVSRRQRELLTTETWAYDSFEDRWERNAGATLPFGCGMNYNLEYDPNHDVLLLVTSEPGRSTSVWALRW
jgi:hypothetical protein